MHSVFFLHRRDVVDFRLIASTEPSVGRHFDLGVFTNKLQKISIARKDSSFKAHLIRYPGDGSQYIICFISINLQYRHVEGRKYIMNPPYLQMKFIRHLLTSTLV